MNSLIVALLAAPALGLPPLPDGDCFTTDFVQTRTLPMLERPLLLNGRIRFEREGALEWEVLHPYRYRFVVSDEKIRETLPNGSERDLDARQAPWLAGVQQLFTALLAGRDDAIGDWFEIAADTETDKGRQLTLQPTNPMVAQAIGNMQVVYGKQLREVRIADAAGGATDIVFESLQACGERQ